MNRTGEKLVVIFAWISGVTLVSIVSYIIGYLIFKGIGTINLQLVFGETRPLEALFFRKQVFHGLFPAVAGTICLVILSVSWAAPVGLASGIYLAEYAQGKTKTFFNLFFDILASIPSIVIGLSGFALAVFLHKHYSERIYPSLLISSLSLSFLVLPYIIRATQVSLESLPLKTRLTALALGGTRLQNIFSVLVPQSLSGILSGLILAIGRCAEDTAVIMLTGVVATAGLPRSVLSPYEALPFYIYYISCEYSNTGELLTGYGASLILLTICIVLFLLAFVIKRQLAYQILYRA